MPARSDAAVIATSVGDRGAFAEIFERHFDAIYSYLARRVGPQLAGDLAAEVFLTAFERRSRYDAGRPDALPWLYGIAANKVRRHRRDEDRRLRALAKSHMTPAAGAEHLFAMDALVAEALVSLQPGDREVLLLYAWADLAYDEIAVALDIPLGTVRSRLHRARRVLSEVLSPRPHVTRTQEASQWTN